MAELVVHGADRPLTGIVPAPTDRAVASMGIFAAALTRPGEVSELRARRISPALPICGALRALGVNVEEADDAVRVTGVGLDGFRAPAAPIDVASSTVALALMTGLVTALPFGATITGSEPVGRACLHPIARVLRLRGGQLEARFVENQPGVLAPPLTIEPSPPPSALVGHRIPPGGFAEKLAALAAGLFAAGDTVLVEPLVTRDALPRLLHAAGATVESAGGLTRLAPLTEPLTPFAFDLPGDLDAGLLLAAAAMAHPESAVGVRSVVVQPSDAGALVALREGGASLSIEARESAAGQATARVTAGSSRPRRILVEGERALGAGVGLPTLAAWAAHASGDSLITGVLPCLTHPEQGERVAFTLSELGVPARWDAATATLGVTGDALHRGPTSANRVIDPRGDGALAMLATVLALTAGGTTRIRSADCIVARFPRFVGSLRALGATLSVES